jgi:hypothetical protein
VQLLGFRQDHVVVVEVADHPRAMLLEQPDALVVDQGGMLDGIDAGIQRVLDALRAVRVRGDAPAGLVRLEHGDAHLLDRELGCSGRIAAREYAAARSHLDEVDPVLDLRAHDVAHLVDSVRLREVPLCGEQRHVHAGRVVVQIAVAAGDADARP